MDGRRLGVSNNQVPRYIDRAIGAFCDDGLQWKGNDTGRGPDRE